MTMVQREPTDEREETETMSCSSQSMESLSSEPKEGGSKRDKEVRQPFPCKVYEMLEDADTKDFKHIVSWNAEGTGFMVHNKDLFISEIATHYFNQTKYKSFQRQLSLYGFQRITAGNKKGLRYHEKLRRGCKHLCREMKPVGYKPRGLEQRDKRLKQQNAEKANRKACTDETLSALELDSSESREEPHLPAVVSSNSLYKDNQRREAQEIVPKMPIARTSLSDLISAMPAVISTDDVGVFEGMPFYLMKTLGDPKCTTPKPVASCGGATVSVASCGGATVSVDGQMKKAWEIGFAVAMTMKTTLFPTVMETACIDALDMHAMNIPV